MRVSILLFALAKHKAGAASVDLDLAEPATVASLKQALGKVCPALLPLMPVFRVAINAEYATDDQAIPNDAELALIPPVSGGFRP